MKTPENKAETNSPNILTPEDKELIRPLLLKLFSARRDEKPLTPLEYKAVKPLLDRQKGGLNREGYQEFREDREVISEAREHQIAKATVVLREPEVRDLLIKFFKAIPGEKPLAPEEFKKITPLVDLQKGGLDRAAYEAGRDDKELTDASSEHRVGKRNLKQIQEEEKSPALAEVARKTETAIDQIRSKRKSQRSQETGAEPEPGE